MADTEVKQTPVATEEIPKVEDKATQVTKKTEESEEKKPEESEEKKPEESEEPEGQKYEFGISMSCGGCSGAVTRVLKKLDGVKSFNVDLQNQNAVVYAEDTLEYETVLRTIHNTNKKVNWGKKNGEEKSVEKVPEVTAAA